MLETESDKQIENIDKNGESEKIIVMIVDDNKLFRKFLYKLLDINLDISLIEVEDPKGAFEYFKVKKPDLILLDMEMPYMDGLTFLKLLRRSDFTKDIPVIPVTGISSKDLIVNLSQYKINDFIIKTAEPKVMIEKIQKAISQIKKD